MHSFFTTLALLVTMAALNGCRALPSREVWSLFPEDQNTDTSPSKLTPSHNRDWLPDLAVLPYAEIEGDEAKLHNIRNCTYRADDEFVVKHYDKTFDLSQINSVDFLVIPFKDTPTLAHTMLSFGFRNGDHVSASVEARLEKQEKYSPVLGALRQYELMYVLADERDVILRRSKFRDSDVYLYRTKATPEQSRRLFVDVLERVNKIYREPEFYDALTNNCTNNIVAHINRISRQPIPAWDLRVLLPGYADQFAYDLGLLDTSKPFEQLREESRISDRANQFASAEDFSNRIRR